MFQLLYKVLYLWNSFKNVVWNSSPFESFHYKLFRIIEKYTESSEASQATLSRLIFQRYLYFHNTSPPTFIRPAEPEPCRLASLPSSLFPACWALRACQAVAKQPVITAGLPISSYLSAHLYQTSGSWTIYLIFNFPFHLPCLLSLLGHSTLHWAACEPRWTSILQPSLYLSSSDLQFLNHTDLQTPKLFRFVDSEWYSPKITKKDLPYMGHQS